MQRCQTDILSLARAWYAARLTMLQLSMNRQAESK